MIIYLIFWRNVTFQDTVLALQAMSELLKFTHGGSGVTGSHGQNLHVKVKAGSENHQFDVNTGNRMVLQNFQVF